MVSVIVLVYLINGIVFTFFTESKLQKKHSRFLTKKHSKTESSVCFSVTLFLLPEKKKEKNPVK